jgi:hypothetical protein
VPELYAFGKPSRPVLGPVFERQLVIAALSKRSHAWSWTLKLFAGATKEEASGNAELI